MSVQIISGVVGKNNVITNSGNAIVTGKKPVLSLDPPPRCFCCHVEVESNTVCASCRLVICPDCTKEENGKKFCAHGDICCDKDECQICAQRTCVNCDTNIVGDKEKCHTCYVPICYECRYAIIDGVVYCSPACYREYLRLP